MNNPIIEDAYEPSSPPSYTKAEQDYNASEEEETALQVYEAARIEWLQYLTFTGMENKDGIIAYRAMIKAGEELDTIRWQ